MSKHDTAISWLKNELFPRKLDGFSEAEWEIIDKAFKEAKEIEKQQMIDFTNSYLDDDADTSAEQYFNETFNQ